jgi:hypothetical protein
MPRLAIMFRVRPGTEDKVRELLANYPAPKWTAADGTRLVSTSVFMKDGIVVRMIDIDGNVPGLVAHIARSRTSRPSSGSWTNTSWRRTGGTRVRPTAHGSSSARR